MHESRTPSAENLALCDWNLYVTNVEEEKHQRMFDIISCSLAERIVIQIVEKSLRISQFR